MRTTFAIALVLLLAGCANRQPTVVEMKVQSQPVATATTTMSTAPSAMPFCLHIRYANEFKVVFTQNDAEAWVTDGACDVNGPRREVAELVLRWRYRHDNPGSKSCAGASGCLLSEQIPGEGKRLACVSGLARDGGFEAAASTDWYACAR